MKFKGKVAAWFWLIIIAVNAVCIYELLFDPDNVPILLFSLALCDIIFIPKTLIISKKPGNTGISRDMRTEFTTHLLHSD